MKAETGSSMSDHRVSYELYQIAVSQFREHPRVFWQRANFFILAQSGLAAVALEFVSRDDETRPATFLIWGLSVIGLAMAVTWLMIIRLGRTHMRTWRRIVLDYESRYMEQHGSGIGPFTYAVSIGREGSIERLSITGWMQVFAFIFGLYWLSFAVYLACLPGSGS